MVRMSLFKKIGVHIFTGRRPEDQVESGDVLALLEKYPLAMLLYLEFLIHNLKSEVGAVGKATLNLTMYCFN